MSTTPLTDVDTELRELLVELSANVGEEYHKLHSGKQNFQLTDARMKFYENKAYARLKVLIGTIVDSQFESLKSELRDYKDKFPDADFHDVLGYIAGVQGRLKLTTPAAGSVTTNPHPDGLEKGDK